MYVVITSIGHEVFNPSDLSTVGRIEWDLSISRANRLVGDAGGGSDRQQVRTNPFGSFSLDPISGNVTGFEVDYWWGKTYDFSFAGFVDASEVFHKVPGKNLYRIDTLGLLSGNDFLHASGHGDLLFAGSGDDLFDVFHEGGKNNFDGGPGTDSVRFWGLRDAYTVHRTRDTIIVANDRADEFVLTSVERLRFLDQQVAYDIDGNAGQAYRIFSAFNRTPDIAGLSYWTNQIDHGQSLASVAESFIASNEFKATLGDPATLSTSRFLDVLYQNMLGRAPDAAGKAYWQGQIDQGASRAVVLASFSESAENVALVGGAIAQGITLNNDWLI